MHVGLFAQICSNCSQFSVSLRRQVNQNSSETPPRVADSGLHSTAHNAQTPPAVSMALRRLARAPAWSSLFQPFTSAAPPEAEAAYASPSYLAHHLLDEFSRPRASRDAARLRRLAAHLTAPAAESVILRLPSWRHALDFFRWADEQPGFRHSCYSFNARPHSCRATSTLTSTALLPTRSPRAAP